MRRANVRRLYQNIDRLNMHYTSQQNDWLVQPFRQPASVQETDNQLHLDNVQQLC